MVVVLIYENIIITDISRGVRAISLHSGTVLAVHSVPLVAHRQFDARPERSQCERAQATDGLLYIECCSAE